MQAVVTGHYYNLSGNETKRPSKATSTVISRTEYTRVEKTVNLIFFRESQLHLSLVGIV